MQFVQEAFDSLGIKGELKQNIEVLEKDPDHLFATKKGEFSSFRAGYFKGLAQFFLCVGFTRPPFTHKDFQEMFEFPEESPFRQVSPDSPMIIAKPFIKEKIQQKELDKDVRVFFKSHLNISKAMEIIKRDFLTLSSPAPDRAAGNPVDEALEEDPLGIYDGVDPDYDSDAVNPNHDSDDALYNDPLFSLDSGRPTPEPSSSSEESDQSEFESEASLPSSSASYPEAEIRNVTVIDENGVPETRF